MAYSGIWILPDSYHSGTFVPLLLVVVVIEEAFRSVMLKNAVVFQSSSIAAWNQMEITYAMIEVQCKAAMNKLGCAGELKWFLKKRCFHAIMLKVRQTKFAVVSLSLWTLHPQQGKFSYLHKSQKMVSRFLCVFFLLQQFR